jgi:DNA-binding transcriptional ArsR family regulator
MTKSVAGDARLEALALTFRALADLTRLKILLVLASGERDVNSLRDEFELPQPTVSHHLGLLKMYNLVNARRQGKHIFYSLVEQPQNNGCCISIGSAAYQVEVCRKK